MQFRRGVSCFFGLHHFVPGPPETKHRETDAGQIPAHGVLRSKRPQNPNPWKNRGVQPALPFFFLLPLIANPQVKSRGVQRLKRTPFFFFSRPFDRKNAHVQIAQVGRGVPVRDLLVPVVSRANEAEGRAALELYARRIYRTHVVDNFSWHDHAAGGESPVYWLVHVGAGAAGLAREFRSHLCVRSVYSGRCMDVAWRGALLSRSFLVAYSSGLFLSLVSAFSPLSDSSSLCPPSIACPCLGLPSIGP